MKRLLLVSIMLLLCGMSHAHDFTVTTNGQKIYFSIKSKKNQTAEVTYNGSISNKNPMHYEGELVIPAKVKHDNVIYNIVGVAPKAFSGADKLTGVEFPSSIGYIGDFAFEGCASLSRIIFPGQSVKFGQGVFFKCDKIQDVSFGSDWTQIDFQMFRWSDSLKVVSIPAKVSKIINMKSLTSLENIVVDVNNARFTSEDGVLYNKNKEVLYGCPRAYQGTLTIVPETKLITKGALIDCSLLEKVILPDSLVTMSYKEFSRMPELSTIVFKSKTPVKTAKLNGKDVFVLKVKNPSVKIIVPKDAKKLYKTELVQSEGEFSEMDEDVPYPVRTDEMPLARNIIGIKKLSKIK